MGGEGLLNLGNAHIEAASCPGWLSLEWGGTDPNGSSFMTEQPSRNQSVTNGAKSGNVSKHSPFECMRITPLRQAA